MWENLAVAADDEGHAGGAQYFLPYMLFFLPGAVLVADGVILIGQKREVQMELRANFVTSFSESGLIPRTATFALS